MRVPYATALDNFIIMCFIAVFAALVEFACINFIDTFVKRAKQRIAAEKANEGEQKEKDKQKMEEAVVNLASYALPATGLEYDKNTLNLPWIEISEEKCVPKEDLLKVTLDDLGQRRLPKLAAPDEDEFDDLDDEEENKKFGESSAQKPSWSANFLLFCGRIPKHYSDLVFKNLELAIEARWGPLTERNFYINTTEVLWTIDEYARKMFPLVFLILQLIYWSSYLYIL